MKPVDISAQLAQYKCISELGDKTPANIPTPAQLGARIWIEQNTSDWEQELLKQEELRQLKRKRANRKNKELLLWVLVFLGFCIGIGLLVGVLTNIFEVVFG